VCQLKDKEYKALYVFQRDTKVSTLREVVSQKCNIQVARLYFKSDQSPREKCLTDDKTLFSHGVGALEGGVICAASFNQLHNIDRVSPSILR
jgi:hypothetical protein